ncbi:MAG: hypothetical protein ACKOE6_04430 [Flammeovirgaceae bacterium]
MNIEQLQFLEHDRLNEFGLDEFFHKTLNSLHDELQRLRNTIYNYSQHHFVFALNERAWVGAFNNAILRAFPETAVTLQEFGVYNKSGFIGRADFLVQWKPDDSKPLYLLFEAKQYEELNKTKLLSDASNYLNFVRKQGQKYFEAETEYYNDKTVLIIPIAFGWIRKEGFLSEAKKYFGGNEKQDGSTDFCSLYFEGEYGAWAYGKVYNARSL